MDDELRDELEALAVAFLTQNLKENPNGVSLQYFERSFPEKMDESPDWYRKNFKMKSVLDALKAIPKAVRLSQHTNGFFVSLNPTSDKVDRHLVDLIVKQKDSSKRRKPSARSQSQRVVDSYRMNRRYTGSANTESRFRAHPPPEHVSRSIHSVSNRSSSYSYQEPQSRYPRSSIYSSQSSRVAPGDPRARSSSHMVPPQVRPAPVTTSGATPSKQSASAVRPHPMTVPHPPTPPVASRVHMQSQFSYEQKSSQVPTAEAKKRTYEDPALGQKRSFYRQRLIQLLSRKHPEVKILYLPRMYEMIYEQKLDPQELGFKNIHELIRDSYFSEYLQINLKTGLHTVSLRNIGHTNGKENITSFDCNFEMNGDSLTSADPLVDRSNIIPASKLKFDAKDPFNTSKMLESLEPIRDIKEAPLGCNKVEDTVKYRTMRIIWKDPTQTLKLDDWERRYQQEWNCSNKIHIRDYGFKTLLEFFKHLASELPIKIQLNEYDEWIAVSEHKSISNWLKSKMAIGSYRAITVIDSKYDQIAYPGDLYPMMGSKDLPTTFFSVNILSVNQSSKTWVQVRDQKRIESHLLIETSLSCYQDYKRQNYFSIPTGMIKVGFPCVVYDESQRRWCRAVVVKHPDNIDDTSAITAFLVDYAITKTFNLSHMMCILKNHLRHPVGLLYCALYNLNKGQERKAKITLEEYCRPPVPLACHIENQSEAPRDDADTVWMSQREMYTVTLIDTNEDKDKNLVNEINTCASED